MRKKKQHEGLTESDRIKVRILESLSKDKEQSFYSLTRKIGTSFNSLVPNCRFMDAVGLIEMKVLKLKDKRYSSLKITKLGRNALAKLKRYRF